MRDVKVNIKNVEFALITLGEYAMPYSIMWGSDLDF